jgi:hypothetical protein
VLTLFWPIDRPLLTTVSKLQIGNGLVRISAGMVGILIHSCIHRQNSNELQSVCRSSQGVLSEITARVRMSCAGPVRIVDGRDRLRRMQGAIGYECWTELDFNNELKGHW